MQRPRHAFGSRYPVAMDNTGSEPTSVTKPSALIGSRLLALFYDLWAAASLWLLLTLVFTVGYYLAGHPVRENIAPLSGLQILLWLCCWLVTAAYALASWRFGGQTLGMRAWRLRLAAADGSAPSWKSLCLRYAVATLSLAAGGLGFWWAWVDRDRLAWHDRLSGTHLVKLPRKNS
jgi:uncharacterized RDD family membrane protein YckC